MTYKPDQRTITHLRYLEAESIHIIREVAAEFDNPVMLYSIGKDSTVMAHLAFKAFAPGKYPFHFCCGHHLQVSRNVRVPFKFREAKASRPNCTQKSRRHCRNINPLIMALVNTDIMKTQGLKQALNLGQYDAAFGGARREEEKSRAKERIYSFRDESINGTQNRRQDVVTLQWKINQGEVRVFPLSNWTELDIWQYLPRMFLCASLCQRTPRSQSKRHSHMIDDERLHDPSEVEMRTVRFRTLGCYPLSGAIESSARNVPDIIQEMMLTRMSERENRLIDFDEEGSMERKKREGYF